MTCFFTVQRYSFFARGTSFSILFHYFDLCELFQPIRASYRNLLTIFPMTPTSEMRAVRLSRFTGWTILVLFGISALAAIPVGTGYVAAIACLIVAAFPGAALAFGTKPAFLGDRFWWTITFIALIITTLMIAALAFVESYWAILTIPAYFLTGLPLAALIRSGRPSMSAYARHIIIGFGALLAALAASLWVQQLLA
jgi:hypothetical protein